MTKHVNPEEVVLDVQTPRAFVPFVGAQHRYQGISGGRGSGKSHFFAEDQVLEALDQHVRVACVREVQKSIKDSVKQLLEDKIDLTAWRYAGASFTHEGVRIPDTGDRRLHRDFMSNWKVTDTEIIYRPTDSLFIFRGLQNHTAASLKSLEGFNRGLFEEAQTLSQKSLDIATPTFRKKSILRFAWNPRKKKDPVDVLFRTNKNDPDFLWRHINYYDNPFFPEDLRKDMLRDRRRDPDKYAHVWLGKYEQRSEARVFRNWRVARFETPANARFYFGADWGFSQDPTVLVRMFIINKTLYIDYERVKVGVEIDQTPAFFAGPDTRTPPRWAPVAGYTGIPGSLKWPITADSARPETISYLRRRGFKITPAVKGAGSVEEGVTFLQDYDIIIHERCVHTIDEFATYSYKVDDKTDEVLPILEDKKNHVIDSARYALEGTRRGTYSLNSRNVGA